MANENKKIIDIVHEKLSDKQWTFSEISNIHVVVEELSKSCYDTLDAKGKIDLLWNQNIENDLTFGDFFQGLVMKSLRSVIALIVKEELESAIIEFKVNKNEISKRSLGGESLSKRPSNEKNINK
tara:strand:+ start:1756 stop:2130 length:375 start_codon:yes stop_codon:yes gene_type:complete